jgi:outer membrane protein OmpA-like peptidoglycan-associated protein
MRLLLFLSAVSLATASPVLAQVTVDLHALQALPERPAGSQNSRSAPPAVTRAPGTVARATPPAAATPVAPPALAPAMPEAEPETAAINPIAPAEPAPGSPPPPPPITDTASTKAAPTTAGLRLTFAPGKSDLSADSAASIKDLTASAPGGDAATFTVQAYAPGTPDDPSTARRVSLSRAMAVRSALVADGVPSSRIFVRALGAQYGDGPPDRVDLSVEGGPGQATQK